ncbi:hypothetical protein [Streptomyces sp. NPDC057280]|uniref:hypothetical protein n=1 Tax=Streptomyces sp. NPDC057280 TaxID=3346081 RepID=UPI00363A4FFA
MAGVVQDREPVGLQVPVACQLDEAHAVLAQQREHELVGQKPGFWPLAAGGHIEDGGAVEVDAVGGRGGERLGEVGGGVGAHAPVDDGVEVVVGGAEAGQ